MNCTSSILPEADRARVFAEIRAGLGELFRPKERLNVWQWAERNRYIAKGVSAKTIEGPRLYSSLDAPHQRGPQEAATDPAVQVTVLVMASQVGGKTEIFNNVLGYHMDQAPRNCIVMYPQVDAATKYSKKKFMPMVEASPCLAQLVKPARTRDSGNTILVKEFRGGAVYFIGANSPTSLRGASGEVLLADEIDSNQVSAGAEGDPVELLFKRAESFPGAVKMLASTPTVKDLSPIWNWFELSDQRYWFVPCPKCGGWQTLAWKQVVWPKDHPEKAELMCVSCAGTLSDRQRVDMYYAGEWRPTAPFNGIRGFHLNGIYVPWPAQKGYENRLHQMAADYLRAVKKGEAALQVWTNTFACELWEVTTEKVEHGPLVKRAEDYGPDRLPEGVVLVLCGVDVQKTWLQCETIGLGLDDETWGIESVKFIGDTEQKRVWEDLAAHLSKTYMRVDGVTLRVSASAIDMRHKPHMVREFAKRSGIPRVYPVYGVATHAPVLVTPRFNKQYHLKTYAIAGRLAKDTIYSRLRVETPGPRYLHFPRGRGYDEKYFQGLTAEVLRRKRVRGMVVEQYEKIYERNEPLDIRVYFLAAIDILNPAMGTIAKRLKPEAEARETTKDTKGEAQTTGAENEPQRRDGRRGEGKARPFRAPRGGFIGGWRK